MKIMAVSIDLNKIDKTRVKSIDPKTGQKWTNGAKYYDITIVLKDEKDKYGNDVAVKQGQTKEERENKAEETFLGNGRTVYNTPPERQQQASISQSSSTTNQAPTGAEDDLPF